MSKLRGILLVRSINDVDACLSGVVRSAAKVQQWIAAFSGEPLSMLRHIKFDQVGVHPTTGEPLNVIEQVNQTWTLLAALAAARHLLQLHPEAGGFRLAPGAHAALPLDIMSEREGLVGAETCAVVDPRNNGKLAKDIAKLATRAERHRYAFFMCPQFPGTVRRTELEKDGVQVWSVDL